MNSGKFRLLSVLVSAAMLASFAVPAVSADETSDTSAADSSKAVKTETVSDEYSSYLESVSAYGDAASDIVIDPTAYISADGCEYDTADGSKKSVLSESNYKIEKGTLSNEYADVNCLVWGDNASFKQQGTVTYQVDVPADALYTVEFEYLPLSKTGGNNNSDDDKSSTSPVEIGLLIDGSSLYKGLDAFSLPRMYVNSAGDTDGDGLINGTSYINPVGEIRTDSLGNELTPEQVAYTEFYTAPVIDPVGVVADPYEILLTAGTHTITLKSIYEPFALASIKLRVPERAPSYEEYKTKHSGASVYAGSPLEIEGEDAFLKSTNSLVAKADNSSPDISPNSAVTSLLNYIGNTNWQTPGESLTWVIDVPETGLYEIGMNYKQVAIIDGYTYRSLAIDGIIPFEECKSIKFDYCTSWQFMNFGDGSNPYYFYLEKGKHTFKLTVTLGETAEFYTRLSKITEKIGDTYIDIVMITGASPDVNRDYDLFRQIPDFQEILLSCHTDITNLVKDMNALSGDRSSKYISALNNMARVLKNMYDNQYTAQTYVNDYYSNYTTVCSWLYEMKTMPLNIDQIQIASPECGFKDNSASVWKSIGFSVKRFFASFSDDFSTIGGTTAASEAGKVTIWVNWGRDQTQVLSNLIQDSFTEKTGISVQLEIVNASLIKGILAGNFPDLSLHLSRTEPVNLGMRGALYDLKNFSSEKDSKYSTVDDGSTYLLDYETVLKRFQKDADMPYHYNDNGTDRLYALPDTQSFFIMFYRTDIFDNLGLGNPADANDGQGWTWDDFLNATTVIQRNNMETYIPYTKIAATTTVNAGMGSLNLFPTILAQNNVPMYNEDNTATRFTSGDAISAFSYWTDLYNKYGIEKQIDFYNRFRVGTVPLGVASYTTYTQLTQAAPEIEGRWAITLIPGVKQEDGTIKRTIAGSGSGCSVVEPSTNKDQAWQFLCWWTDAETQLRYNNNVESILGAVSRTATANVEAFNLYSWNADDLDILNSQWEQVEELAELPGGYYVARALDQAYWAVLNNEMNAKDAMLEWGEVADNEIKRKIAEYKN